MKILALASTASFWSQTTATMSTNPLEALAAAAGDQDPVVTEEETTAVNADGPVMTRRRSSQLKANGQQQQQQSVLDTGLAADNSSHGNTLRKRGRGGGDEYDDDEYDGDEVEYEHEGGEEEEEVPSDSGPGRKKRRTVSVGGSGSGSSNEEWDSADDEESDFDDDDGREGGGAFGIVGSDDLSMQVKKLQVRLSQYDAKDKKWEKLVRKKDRSIKKLTADCDKYQGKAEDLLLRIENDLYNDKEVNDLIKEKVAAIKADRISKTECNSRIAEAKKPITAENAALKQTNRELLSKTKNLQKELAAKKKQYDDVLKSSQADKTKYESTIASLQSKVAALQSDEMEKKRQHEKDILQLKQEDEEKKHIRQVELLDKKAAATKDAHEMKDTSANSKMVFQQNRREAETAEKMMRLQNAASRTDRVRQSHAAGGGNDSYLASTASYAGNFANAALPAPAAPTAGRRRRQQQQQQQMMMMMPQYNPFGATAPMGPMGNQMVQNMALGGFMDSNQPAAQVLNLLNSLTGNSHRPSNETSSVAPSSVATTRMSSAGALLGFADFQEYQGLLQQQPNMSVQEFLQYQAFKSSAGHGGEEDSLATGGGLPPNPPVPSVIAAIHRPLNADPAGPHGGLGIQAVEQQQPLGMPPLGGGGGGDGGGGAGGSGIGDGDGDAEGVVPLLR